VVRWTAPASDGGAPIYGYEVQAVDPATGIATAVDAAGPGATSLTMTGLGAGVPCAFRVTAVNAAGASAFSALSNTVIPTAAGATPGIPTPTPTPTRTTAPTRTPTSSPTPTGPRPTTPTPGTTTTTPASVPTRPGSGPTTPGSGPMSPGSGPTTPGSGPTPNPTTTPASGHPVAPGAPRIGTVTGGNGLAVVRWTAPVSNGGSPIVRYETEVLTASGARLGALRIASPTAALLGVTGLTSGNVYRFRVRAVNAAGAGTWSALSAALVARTTSAAPARLTAASGRPGGIRTATATWTAPTRNGGSLITAYRVTWQPVNATGKPAGRPIVQIRPASARTAALTTRSGTRVRVMVQAVNAIGSGTGRSVFVTTR